MQRLVGVGRRGEAAERPRDGIQPIDLPQDSVGRFFQGPVELARAIAVYPPQVLHSQSHRRQWIFDFVRHLARHLAPREDTLGSGDIRHVVERHDETSDFGPQ
jgi:hypothetical protein